VKRLRLVYGGSGSGKSDLAEGLLDTCLDKIYLATMPFAGENIGRIDRHRRRRAGKGFWTIERTKDISGLPLADNAVVLLEDLPNLLANTMFLPDGTVDYHADDKVREDLLYLIDRCMELVIVSDDIFSSGISYDRLTERYMSMLGSLHGFLANKGEMIEVVAGIGIYHSSLNRLE